MRVLRATINGFGNWVDKTIDFENKSFICLYGENETGKSTMHQFILFMLFGFSPKYRTFYRPKTSSRMGGRLLVADASYGEFTIERFDEVRNGQALCYAPDGSEFTEDWLKERLRGMTYQTYQSIFSFSSMDLYGIHKMSDVDLGEVLLGIGLTGSNNILAIEKDLDNQMGALFKPFGTKPMMNQQLDKLDDLFQQLTRHENDESTYREKKRHIQSLHDMTNAYQRAYTLKKDKHHLIQKQLQALPLIEDYKYCTDQLKEYPDSLSFPEKGLDRLHYLNEKALPLKSELAVLQDNYKQYNEKVCDLKQQLYDDTFYEQVETLLLTKQTFLDTKRDIKLLQKTIENEKLQIQTDLEQLQIGMTIGDLKRMTFPFYLERTWNELKQTSEQLHLERQQLEDELFLLKGKMERVEMEQKELESTLPAEKDIFKLTEKVEAFHRQDYVQSQSEKETKSKLKWVEMAKKKRKRSNIFLSGLALLAILFAIVPIMGNASNTFLILSGFVLTVGISQWIWQKQSIKSLSVLFKTNELTDMNASITKEDKDDAAYKLLEARKKQQALHTLLDKKRSFEIQMLQQEEKEQGLQAKETRLANQIQEQYDIYPFLMETNIMYWTELFQKLKHLHQFVQKQRKQTEELTQLTSTQDALLDELTSFFEQHEMTYDKRDARSQFELLDTLMEQYHASESNRKQYQEWMEKNKRNQQEVHQQILTFEEEMAILYKHANVPNAEEFYIVANKVEEKNKLETKIDQLDHQIATILTSSEYQVMLNNTFNSFDLQEQMEQAELKMEELTNKMEDIRQELASEEVKRTNMEASEDYSETKQRFQMEQEQLEKWTYEWSILKTAKEMLGDTKRIYRDKYLQKVMDKTSAYFSTLTGERYKRIFAPSRDTFFQVESNDLIRYNIEELSKGTIDQLYISLRIAISEVLSQDLLLPFVMDDAFVHFDSIRTERMMHIFSELAAKQQIIIFTSNKDILHTAQNMHAIDLGKQFAFTDK